LKKKSDFDAQRRSFTDTEQPLAYYDSIRNLTKVGHLPYFGEKYFFNRVCGDDFHF
jgi:hypothetical protein